MLVRPCMVWLSGGLQKLDQVVGRTVVGFNVWRQCPPPLPARKEEDWMRGIGSSCYRTRKLTGHRCKIEFVGGMATERSLPRLRIFGMLGGEATSF
jgi:hypothetical protein